MRVAVILTGAPRFLKENSFWVKNRQFSSQAFKNIEFDYFTYFWDNLTDNVWPGNNKIYDVQSAEYFREFYDSKDSVLFNFNEIADKFMSDIIHYHNSDSEKKAGFLKKNKRLYNSFLFQSDDPHELNMGKGAWGQFLSISYAAERFDYYLKDYDIIIKTRSDAILDTISEDIWLQLFTSIVNESKRLSGNYIFEKNIIYTNLLRNLAGYHFIDDKFLIATPDVWQNYSKNSRESLLKLATTDCLALYDLTFDQHTACDWEVVLWSKLFYYSQTSLKSIYQNFKIDIGDIVLIRKNYNESEMEYKLVREDYYNFYLSNINN
jgi:hypothetical protein